MAIMFLSEENFTCSKRQIMHKQLSLALIVLIPNVNFFENSMKPAINSIENSVDPDQLASEEEASWSGSTLFSKHQASLK